jgi:hypothetical protein
MGRYKSCRIHRALTRLSGHQIRASPAFGADNEAATYMPAVSSELVLGVAS